MLDRMQLGEVPAKHHIAFRGPDGKLRFEECLTRRGFEGEYSILYHEAHPTADVTLDPTEPGPFDRKAPEVDASAPLHRRLLRGDRAPQGITPILASTDIVVSIVRLPVEAATDAGFSNGDGDDLYFFEAGRATLESPFGDVDAAAGDYLLVPRGVIHRLRIHEPIEGLLLELRGGFHVPEQFRNPMGQLKMDAPYSHRDFVRPVFRGPREGPKTIINKRDDKLFKRVPANSPFDVVGWDGFVWPFAFPILNYQPKTGMVHLPPTIHTTFAARGALICSFVPRLTDYHPDAIPCPYPHASVDCDEIMYYVRGNFTSRKGVGPKSISLHPAGIAHGPAPSGYEGSIGSRSTEELAVMVDTFVPVRLTKQALDIELRGYHDSLKDDLSASVPSARCV